MEAYDLQQISFNFSVWLKLYGYFFPW